MKINLLNIFLDISKRFYLGYNLQTVNELIRNKKITSIKLYLVSLITLNIRAGNKNNTFSLTYKHKKYRNKFKKSLIYLRKLWE
jgi:hypothetical protein